MICRRIYNRRIVSEASTQNSNWPRYFLIRFPFSAFVKQAAPNWKPNQGNKPDDLAALMGLNPGYAVFRYEIDKIRAVGHNLDPPKCLKQEVHPRHGADEEVSERVEWVGDALRCCSRSVA